MKDTMVQTPLGKKRMSFIVRCLQSHAPLCEALENALEQIKSIDEDYDLFGSWQGGMEALERAKGCTCDAGGSAGCPIHDEAV